jgi:hypothetical protein
VRKLSVVSAGAVVIMQRMYTAQYGKFLADYFFTTAAQLLNPDTENEVVVTVVLIYHFDKRCSSITLHYH